MGPLVSPKKCPVGWHHSREACTAVDAHDNDLGSWGWRSAVPWSLQEARAMVTLNNAVIKNAQLF